MRSIVLKIVKVTDDALRRAILRAYKRNAWNTTRTAADLGVPRRSLLRLVNQLSIKDNINENREPRATP